MPSFTESEAFVAADKFLAAKKRAETATAKAYPVGARVNGHFDGRYLPGTVVAQVADDPSRVAVRFEAGSPFGADPYPVVIANLRQVYRCECCGWEGEADDHGVNPRQGHRRCPRCEKHGDDVLTDQIVSVPCPSRETVTA